MGLQTIGHLSKSAQAECHSLIVWKMHLLSRLVDGVFLIKQAKQAGNSEHCAQTTVMARRPSQVQI